MASTHHFRPFAFALLIALSCLAASVACAQTRMTSDINVGLNLASDGVGADVGAQLNFAPHLSLAGSLGAGVPFGRKDVNRDIRGGELLDARLTERTLQRIGLRLYENTNHTGFFGGLDYEQQQVNVKATSRGDANLLTLAGDLFEFALLGPFKRGSVADVKRDTKVRTRGWRLEAGYAFDFGGGGILAVSVRGGNAQTADTYTFDGLGEDDVERSFKNDFSLSSFGLQATYRVPLGRR